MIDIKSSDMDKNSREIHQDDKFIGYLQKHSGKDSGIILHYTFTYLTLSEMHYIISEYESWIK